MKAKFPSAVFVCGIGTGVGKTMVSALLVNILQADYWKPIQTGPEEESDTNFLRKWVAAKATTLHKETYHFATPVSPHLAAQLEHVIIDLASVHLPIFANHLVVESAGGILVPLNDRETNLDLIKKLNIPVIIVANEYLGSINHTLLTIEVLRQHNCDLLGLVFCGETYLDNEKIIATHSQVPIFGRVDKLVEVNLENMNIAVEKLGASLANYFEWSKDGR